MSSAILYVAIVAIWAGVLIPRWLRRDSSASSADELAGDGRTAAEPGPAVTEEPAPRPRHRPDAVRPPVRPEGPAAARPETPAAGGAELPRGGARDQEQRDQEHRKVLAARRRLLGLLLVLVTGSGALAFNRLAAWWVIVPPVIMLLGYTALLREAAKSDAERRELDRTRVAAAAAAVRSAAARTAAPAARAPAPAATAPATATAATATAAPAPALAPAPGAAPGAEVIDISASVTPGEEKLYDQYADAKLRAVGDLACALAG